MPDFADEQFSDANGYAFTDTAVNTDWQGPQGDYYGRSFAPPPVPGAEGAGSAPVQVNTEAMKTFASNLRALLGPLQQVRDQTGEIDVKPGAFFHAHELQNQVQGDGTNQGGGLVQTTRQFVMKSIDAITMTADSMEKLANGYQQTEEVNLMTVADLDDYMQDAKGYVESAVGTAVGTGTGLDTDTSTDTSTDTGTGTETGTGTDDGDPGAQA